MTPSHWWDLGYTPDLNFSDRGWDSDDALPLVGFRPSDLLYFPDRGWDTEDALSLVGLRPSDLLNFPDRG
jgi:hypothetical protein